MAVSATQGKIKATMTLKNALVTIIAAIQAAADPMHLPNPVRLLEEKASQQVVSLKKFRRLEQEKNILLKEKKALEKELNNRLDGLSNEAAVSLKKFRRLEQEKNIIVKEKKALEKELNNRPDVPTLFHGHYKFGPENIQDLSRLISMHLMDKPSGIDRDRIYDCVSKLMSRYLADKPRGRERKGGMGIYHSLSFMIS
eukprot:scaffold5572_cov83-Skeletonema_dohrnii-CCMP3373.AAC.1